MYYYSLQLSVFAKGFFRYEGWLCVYLGANLAFTLCRNCGVYLGAKGVDRAKDARIRAKKARDKRKNRNYQEHACSVRYYNIGCARIQTATSIWATEVGYVLLVKTVPDNFHNNMYLYLSSQYLSKFFALVSKSF